MEKMKNVQVANWAFDVDPDIKNTRKALALHKRERYRDKKAVLEKVSDNPPTWKEKLVPLSERYTVSEGFIVEFFPSFSEVDDHYNKGEQVYIEDVEGKVLVTAMPMSDGLTLKELLLSVYPLTVEVGIAV